MHARIAIALVVSFVAFGFQDNVATADHDQFAYKMPCAPGLFCPLTQQVHSGGSLDFDINGWPSSGMIQALSEGTIVDLPITSAQCTTSGLGRQAWLSDIHGRTNIYAHLASYADIGLGYELFQG